MDLTNISLQWDLARFGFFSAILGAAVGGILTFLGSYYLWDRQRRDELKNVARAIDIDLERVYESNQDWFDLYKDERKIGDFESQGGPVVSLKEFYNCNGIYFIFNHDISKFDYGLSSQIYTFYSGLLDAESSRQFVVKNKRHLGMKGDDPRLYLSYENMKSMIIFIMGQIPDIQKQLKEVYDC